MTDSTHSSRASHGSALFLDYGADAQPCEAGTVALSERGMRFQSRWQFAIGTQINVALVNPQPRHGHERLTVEGIVVYCERLPQGCYESTLLFLELPDELIPSVRDFSFELEG